MVRAAGAATEEAMSAGTRMQALHDAHAKAVYFFLLKMTRGERQLAEDLTQETMLRACGKIDGLDPDIGVLRPWLYTVARRVAIDASRARQARPVEVFAVDLSVRPEAGDAIDRMLRLEVLGQALRNLSPEHRSVIVEGYYRGRTVAEIAEVLGIPSGTVKSRTHYALRSLREALGSPAAVF